MVWLSEQKQADRLTVCVLQSNTNRMCKHTEFALQLIREYTWADHDRILCKFKTAFAEGRTAKDKNKKDNEHEPMKMYKIL